MAILDLDLSVPSFRAAYQHARVIAMSGDRAGADKLFARLLWHVRAEDGGFIGLSDAQMAEKIAGDPRLNTRDVYDAMYEPGSWPAAEAKAEAA